MTSEATAPRRELVRRDRQFRCAPTRRDFLFIATATVGAVGASAAFLAFH